MNRSSYEVSVSEDIGGMAVFAASTSGAEVEDAAGSMTLHQLDDDYIAAGAKVRRLVR
jgi:hypothetical protein